MSASTRTLSRHERHATIQRVIAFSVLGLLVVVMLLGLFKPDGVGSAPAHEATPVHLATDATQPTRLRGSDVGWEHVPALVLTGLAAGFLSGIIGMGGGVLKMCFMLLFLQFDIFFARAISVVTMFLSSSSALWGYMKRRLLVWPYAFRMAAVGAPAGFFAAALGNHLQESTLTLVFAFFIIFLGLNMLAFLLGDPGERAMDATPNRRPGGNEGYYCGAIGGFHGTACGLLGISGGVIATPLQQLMLHMPLRHAIGNTLVVSTVVTFVASVAVLSTGAPQASTFTLSDVLFVDLFMGGGAVIGAPIGTYLGDRVNVSVLRLLFVALTLGAGVSILTG